MKKIVSILVVIALLMSLTVSAFATETPTLTVSSAEAQVGDEVTLEVTISEATFAAFGLTVTYDSEALELTRIKKGSDLGDALDIVEEDGGFASFVGSKDTGIVTVFGNANMDVEGQLLTLKFTVLAAGEHTVGLAIDSFNLADQSEVEVTAVAGTISVAGEEEPELPEVENPLVIGDNEIVLPLNATEASVYNFVATETGTLYIAASNFMYEGSWTEGEFVEDDYGQDHWRDTTIFTVNGEMLEGNFYGSVEVVAGEVYTFSWAPNGNYYGYKATLNLSYTDENIPVPGVGIDLLPTDLPRNTVEIPAGEMVLYTISYEFSGYILSIYGENAYIYYESYDWWTGENVVTRIDAVDGVVEYSIDEHNTREFYIGNDGTEAASFEMDCYAPEGGEKNPIVVEKLEDITVSAAAGEEYYVYFHWTSDILGTIIVNTETVGVYFYNETLGESGEYGDDWISYSVYVEPGDELLIGINGYAEEDLVYNFEYELVEGYRLGSEANPFPVDLVAGMDVNLYSETVFYSWTPETNMVVTLGFTLKYTWSSNLPTIMINGEAYTLDTELTVTAGEPLVFSLSATNSVYGTLQATVISSEEPPVEEPEIIAEGDVAVEVTETYTYIDLYEFVAPVAGTYTFYIPAGLGVVDANAGWFDPPIIDFYENAEGFEYVIDLAEGEVFSFYIGAIEAGQFVITYTAVESEQGEEPGPVDPVIPDGAVNMIIGNNNINAADITFVYTASEAGTLTLNLGVTIMGAVEGVVTVNFENAQNLYTMGQIVLELNAGDVVLVEFTAAGYATMTAEWETEGGEDPVPCEHEYVDGVCIHCGEEDPNYVPPVEEPDGSSSNPFIIEELPYTAVQNTSDDLYYKWTATEAGVLYVNNNDGVFILKNQNGTYGDYTDTGKCIAVVAGDVITINYWSGTGFTVEFVAGSGEAEPGTEANPIIIDSLNITLTKDDDEIYYAWIATESGEIVIRVAECTWSFGYSLTINGQSLFGAGAELTLNVEAGDQIIIMIVVYPSATNDGHLTLEQVVEQHECVFVVTDSKDATCTEDGYVTYTCECGETYTETVPATGHNYEAVVTAPTCTEAGFTTYTCSVCGDSYVADEVPATGHTHVITDSKDATCTEDGYVTYTCECGDTYTETVAATGHNFVDGVCTNCGAEDPNYVPECEHNFVDGVCTNCGAEDPNYNPGTGSLNFMAIALIAMMSVTAVVVTATKKEH